MADRESTATSKGETSFEELTKLEQTVARRMAESKATVPHLYLSTEIEMTRAVEARAGIEAVIKAAAVALREHPRANGGYRDGRIALHSRVNVGVVVPSGDAFLVPTVFDADRKDLGEIAAELRAVAAKVQDGTITAPELSGGTFTVSSLGESGVGSFAAVINPPQAAILAVGAIVERPVVRGSEIAAAPIMTVTLACDHRILHGADAAEFLARIRALLEEPAEGERMIE